MKNNACFRRCGDMHGRGMLQEALRSLPGWAQGTGKTTAAGKLALYLKKRGLKVLLVATDVYRPGAGQLSFLAQLGS